MTARSCSRSLLLPATRGFALISVLWTLSTLALITSAIATAGALSYVMSRNAWTAIEAELAIDAALNRAVLSLLDQRPDYRWRLDGTVEEFVFDGTRLRIAVQDELGKVDLNAADQSLIDSLFTAAGMASREAGILAARVVEWRSEERSDGAAAAVYRLEGRIYRPRNAPFETIDELNLVLGVTPQLFARVKSSITVYSQRPGFDPQTAPQLVLMTSMDSASAERIIAERHGARRGTDNVGGPDRFPPQGLTAGRAFSIRIEIPDMNPQVAREIVVQLTGDARRPYWIRAWR